MGKPLSLEYLSQFDAYLDDARRDASGNVSVPGATAQQLVEDLRNANHNARRLALEEAHDEIRKLLLPRKDAVEIQDHVDRAFNIGVQTCLNVINLLKSRV